MTWTIDQNCYIVISGRLACLCCGRFQWKLRENYFHHRTRIVLVVKKFASQ